MAGSSLLALIDDIASVLDDVSAMTKVATKKTAGVLGDDLALNAEQVAGVRAEREIPVVLAVARGSAINKLILVPTALAISALIPWAVTLLLMLGGLFLCFEGAEKLLHKLLHPADEAAEHQQHKQALADPAVDLVAFEKQKIKGAVRTDFILSAEIIVLTLGTVADASFGKQVAVLCIIAVVMTIGVYGLVAGIVKLDDLGLYLCRMGHGLRHVLGGVILRVSPWLMKSLSVLGTAAMFMVGGGILIHGIPLLHHWVEGAAHDALGLPGVGAVVSGLTPTLLNALAGAVAGAVAVGVITLGRRVLGLRAAS